jgi:hypothetical protein
MDGLSPTSPLLSFGLQFTVSTARNICHCNAKPFGYSDGCYILVLVLRYGHLKLFALTSCLVLFLCVVWSKSFQRSCAFYGLQSYSFLMMWAILLNWISAISSSNTSNLVSHWEIRRYLSYRQCHWLTVPCQVVSCLAECPGWIIILGT